MSVKVAKFGGSSLSEASRIRRCAEIVKADPARRYVVPSAPGKRSDDDRKVTDLLYLCQAHIEQDIPFNEVFALIENRYLEIVEELGLDLDMKSHLMEVWEQMRVQKSADYAASRGEYLNGLIMAELLGYDFVDPAEMICFNEHGRFDAELTNTRVSERLSQHETAVVPGFFGATPDGKVKTFSRGGSDVTGAIVARAVEAEVYENWTDVPGLLMTDPRIVTGAEAIEYVTYRELRELAYMGASVLHDEAIFPVRQSGIPVNIRSTIEPEKAGTMIVSGVNEYKGKYAITGIAGRKDFTVINIEKALMNTEVGFGRRLLDVVEHHRISFEHMPSGIDTLSLVISDDQLEGKLDDLVAAIESELKPDCVKVDPDLALIATVGRGMNRIPGMAAKVFGALGEAGVNIRMIDQGSGELNIIVGVNVTDFKTAVRAIYDAFVV